MVSVHSRQTIPFSRKHVLGSFPPRLLGNSGFNLRKLNRAELDRFLATLSRQLEVVFEATFTERILENVLCKAFWELKGTTKMTQTA
jgi:hypothetical protein